MSYYFDPHNKYMLNYAPPLAIATAYTGDNNVYINAAAAAPVAARPVRLVSIRLSFADQEIPIMVIENDIHDLKNKVLELISLHPTSQKLIVDDDRTGSRDVREADIIENKRVRVIEPPDYTKEIFLASAVYNNYPLAVDFWLNRNPNLQNMGHLLIEVVRRHDLGLLRKLIGAGIPLNGKDHHNNTPLHIPVYQLEIIRELIRAGAPLDGRNAWGQTPLHIAVQYQYLENIRELIRAGASLDVRDVWGQTPLDLAARVNNLEIINELTRAKAARGR